MVYDIFIQNFQIFLVIFARVMGLFIAAPFFQGNILPLSNRLGLAFFVSILGSSIIIAKGFIDIPLSFGFYGVLLINNFIIGAGIGFFALVIFTSFQVAAQMFSLPMGIGITEMMDPLSGANLPVLGNLLNAILMLLLFELNGHITFINAILKSFEYLPTLSTQNLYILLSGLFEAMKVMFIIGLQIAMPIIAVTILFDIGMGLISRVAPQFNIMIMGFNIKILLGFIILLLIIPTLIDIGSHVITELLTSMNRLIMEFSK